MQESLHSLEQELSHFRELVSQRDATIEDLEYQLSEAMNNL